MSAAATHDLVVAGFGPSGIALAAAVEDHDDTTGAPLRTRYLEKAADSAWQPNLVLPGTDIQHHFLRDFATPRDARSRFTFPHYLQQSGRFYPFTLMGGYVSRLEWSDYVQWAARQVRGPVDYHREVLAIEPVTDPDGRVRTVDVLSRDPRDGSEHRHRTRNAVLATGHVPYVPAEFEPHLGERVFHASQLLPRLAAFEGRPPRRVAVIGAGQTAGEIVLHLSALYPDAEIHSVVRHAGFRMYELGHFSNEVYFPEATDYFYGLEGPERARALDQSRATNYAAVDPDVSSALYQAAYQDRFTGRDRLRLHRRTEATVAAAPTADGVPLRLREVFTGEAQTVDADLVVLCTGYREPELPAALEPLKPYLRLDADGRPAVTRAFRAETDDRLEAGIYLDGLTEWRHGIGSATSFSQMADRADTVHRDLRARLGAPAPATPVAV